MMVVRLTAKVTHTKFRLKNIVIYNLFPGRFLGIISLSYHSFIVIMVILKCKLNHT